MSRFGRLLKGGGRARGGRGAAGGEALDALLLLAADRVIDPVAGRSEPLAERTPEGVARAARRLVAADRPRLALALPGHEFFALSLQLPGLSAEQLHDAIQLQLPDLLPGVERPMALRVVPPASAGGRVLALWLDAERAESLFHAFENHGLFLAALSPRLALSPPPDGEGWCCEREEGFVTCAEWSAGRVSQWMSTAVEDLEQEVLNEQWQAALGGVEPAPLEGEEAWSALGIAARMPPLEFVPRAARQHMERVRRRRRRRLQTVAALLVAGVLLSGWGALNGRMAYFEKKLEGFKVEAREASRLRAEVVEIETRLAPIRDFPHQDVAGVLQLLNGRIPRDSWIERMRIDDGVVELEGYSPDPAGLVAALAEDERFEEVAFSRATRGSSGRQSGDRFGIRFRLADVDVAAYLQEHFPVER